MAPGRWLTLSFKIGFANDVPYFWNCLQVLLFYGPRFILWVSANPRKTLLHPCCWWWDSKFWCLIQRDSQGGGSLLLQVALYEIFSILCASGCQIRLIWNTIIKRGASHTRHCKLVIFKLCIRTWKLKNNIFLQPPFRKLELSCPHHDALRTAWSVCLLLSHDRHSCRRKMEYYYYFFKFYLRPHLKNDIDLYPKTMPQSEIIKDWW